MRLTSQLGTFTLHFRGTYLLLLQARQVTDQISGIFFGWAKLEGHGVSEVVVSIGWDLSLRTVQRVMHHLSICLPSPSPPINGVCWSGPRDQRHRAERRRGLRNQSWVSASIWASNIRP